MALADMKYRFRAHPYELLEQIGGSACFEVFKALDRQGRIVALKVLKRQWSADRQVVDRTLREVFAIATLDSPNIVSLYDFDTAGDEVFIALEYVEGITLRQYLEKRGPLPLEEAVNIVGQIAEALSAAARKQIVHRDLKPENIMVCENSPYLPRIKVLDFGLAKLVDLERSLQLTKLTQVGTCVGTPRYIAPEVLRGDAVDHRADLFALSVILYELASGRSPWNEHDPATTAISVLQDEPRPLECPQLAGRLRARLEGFLRRSLSKQPDDRFPDAETFVDALRTTLTPPGRPADPDDEAAFAKTTVRAQPASAEAPPSSLPLEVAASTVAAAAGLSPLILAPHGTILYGLLAVTVAALLFFHRMRACRTRAPQPATSSFEVIR